jgi:hypothetical protein
VTPREEDPDDVDDVDDGQQDGQEDTSPRPRRFGETDREYADRVLDYVRSKT